MEGAAVVWREDVGVDGGRPGGGTAGVGGAGQGPCGEGWGGPDEDAEVASWPPWDPDMPDPLLPRLTFPHPRDPGWLLNNTKPQM